MAEQKEPKCPECGNRMTKFGWRITNRKGDRKQQYFCPACRRVTRNPKY